MIHLAALLIFGTVLTACSGSSRVADVVPASANTAPRGGALQYEAREKRVEGRSKPDAESQGAKKPVAQPPEE